ncbi:MAG TPA: phosphoglycerate kinase [Acidobacteriota bacterium]|nr:phosphoglycerate kinase [Acidobacteriota bacterium]
MNKLTIEDLQLQGKKALIRVDFNVPLEDGKVSDDTRIKAALPTIRYALEKGAAVILMSHLGRPAGQADQALSLRPVADRLSRLLESEVAFAEDCVGQEAQEAAARLQAGQVLLLENLRFHPGEKKPEAEPDFAGKLASLGDVYINDAFGTAHRPHSSMVAVAESFEKRAAGFLLAKEIDYFQRVLDNPATPFLAILGGAKVSDKIGVIQNLLEKVDILLVGGAMAYTFLKAGGVEVGDSRVEEDKLPLALKLIRQAAQKDVELILPQDHVCGREFKEDTERGQTPGASIPKGWMGLDIGPRTVQVFRDRIEQARLIVWNGPMGVFEWPRFSRGTQRIAKACAESPAVTIIGGGDSASAAQRSGLADRFDHISTGGGASLEMLEGKKLPGVEVLTDA